MAKKGEDTAVKTPQTAAARALRADEQAPYFFHQGTSTHAYDYLGAHRENGRFVFRVWAPNAEFVSVIGDFNGWDPEASPLGKVTHGVWEVSLPEEQVREGQNYKFLLRNHGREILKADPYGFSMQRPPETASVVTDLSGYAWRDEGWMRYRKTRFTREKVFSQPINIYELHLGSWKRHENGEPYSYRELAAELVPYVKQMGYTHIEIMPVSEFPYDGSWGYQVCGYYAPTARFGSPKDFMAFVDAFHEAGIGVILDWVPAHFPKDAHGLCEFDGQPLYEYQGADRMEHATWGTRKFDVGREEVQSFLISNAFFWIEQYHLDGLRVDAVASMLYLDYDKRPGEWVPNIYGGRECLEAIAFFQKLNGLLEKHHPDVMTVAEESTAWANITGFENGGLGFTMKWNMGWMNDSLAYIKEDPYFRPHHHHKLTFSLTYAFSEKFVLPVSHDEVVHGKLSLLDRNHGSYEQKFAGARAYLTYMMTHPGKKLLFMGCELGQFREWAYEEELEWFLLDYPMHARFQQFVAELNHLYLQSPALWECDGGWEGFCWIDADNTAQSVYSYRRIDRQGKELLILLNLQPVRREGFCLRVPTAGVYEEVLNTDEERFGGGGDVNREPLRTKDADGTPTLSLNLPAMGATILRCKRRAPARKPKPTAD